MKHIRLIIVLIHSIAFSTLVAQAAINFNFTLQGNPPLYNQIHGEKDVTVTIDGLDLTLKTTDT